MPEIAVHIISACERSIFATRNLYAVSDDVATLDEQPDVLGYRVGSKAAYQRFIVHSETWELSIGSIPVLVDRKHICGSELVGVGRSRRLQVHLDNTYCALTFDDA